MAIIFEMESLSLSISLSMFNLRKIVDEKTTPVIPGFFKIKYILLF